MRVQTENLLICIENYSKAKLPDQKLTQELDAYKAWFTKQFNDEVNGKAISANFNKGFSSNVSGYIDNLTTRYDFYTKQYKNTTYGRLTNVASFMNDIVNADDSKKLGDVIASYASPPQSYRAKRYTPTSVMFNAYVGVRMGLETSQEKWKPGYAHGLTAPIGISFNRARRNKKSDGTPALSKEGTVMNLTGASGSLVVNLFDLGAVVSYRFAKTEYANGLPQKVKFSQFISPSVQYHCGLKNLPLNIFAGIQYLPEFRSFSFVGRQEPVYQFNGGIMFDLPLFKVSDSNTRALNKKY